MPRPLSPPISAVHALLKGLGQQPGRPEMRKLLEPPTEARSKPIQQLLGQEAAIPGPEPDPDFMDIDLNDIPNVLARVYADPGDKSEKMVFITDDGKMLVIGGTGKNAVPVSLVTVIKKLAKRGQSMGNITSIIHNHSHGEDFSQEDLRALKKLRKAGFKGMYKIFTPGKGSLRTHKD